MVLVSLISSCSFDLLGCCSRGQIQGWVRPVREACFVVLRPGQHVRVLDSTYVFWTARMEIAGPWRGEEHMESAHCNSSFRAGQLSAYPGLYPPAELRHQGLLATIIHHAPHQKKTRTRMPSGAMRGTMRAVKRPDKHPLLCCVSMPESADLPPIGDCSHCREEIETYHVLFRNPAGAPHFRIHRWARHYS